MAVRWGYSKGLALALTIFLLVSTSCISKTAFDELQVQLNKNQQQLSVQQAEVARLTTALTQEQAKANNVATQLDQLKAELSSTQNKTSKLDSQLLSVKSELSNALNKASELGKQLSGLQSSLVAEKLSGSKLTTELSESRNTITNLGKQIDSLRLELSQSKDSNALLNRQIDSLTSELSQTKKAITALAPSPSASLPAPLSSKNTTSSSKESLNLGDGIIFTYEPAQPVTGRPVRFGLEGLTPWASASITFVNPGRMLADWIDETEVFYTQTGSQELLKTKSIIADGNGKITWARPNVLDPEGQWTVQIKVNNKTYNGIYTLTPVPLQVNSTSHLNVPFRQYSGSISEVFVTPGVPLALALDLSGMLYSINETLKPWLSQSYVQIPNLYLFSSRELFNKAITSTGKTPTGFEAGMFISGKNRGIYIITDSVKSETIKTLIHEYTHLIIDEALPNAEIPAWLNEGLATYLELHAAPEFGVRLLAQREVFSRAENVYVNLVRGSLFSLSKLRNQKDWNAQTSNGLSYLQYSQSYMAVRYMVERFGNQTVASILKELKNGQPYDAAFQKTAGISVATFEQDWLGWQKNWKDSKREDVRQYVNQTDTIMKDISSIGQDRNNFVRTESSIPLSSRIFTQEQLVSRAATLESKAATLSPPSHLIDLHAELTAFSSLYKKWLQTALDAFRQGNNTLIEKANAMIPEVNGREMRLFSQLYDVKFDWGLAQ